ncbi:MAG: ACP S-malonyltransferase [Candidatus Delongbacteria bacterium]|nr:ACP S-malonyltransferase [Candidatus Delongbacteria bacterium]
MQAVVLGPGQASQYVGMGKSFYDAFPYVREIFELAEQVAKIPVSRLCFEGPDDLLTRTDNVQVCLTTVSIAGLEVLRRETGFEIKAAAGHSLGEYVALYGAGVFDLPGVIAAVAKRGKSMQQAAEQCRGGMMAVMGLSLDKIEACVAQLSSFGVITIANINSPKQVILSGESGLLEQAGNQMMQAGALKIVPLNVSGPWHSSFMEPAAHQMAEFLSTVTLNPPAFPVYSNVTAQAYPADPDQIKNLLVRQITSPVRWTDLIDDLRQMQVPLWIELAPNQVLKGIIRQIDKGLKVVSVDTVAVLQELPSL